MKNNIKLGNRLQKCADFVPNNAKLLDIGTDHGYLPIWLIKSDKIKTAIAADVAQEPLQSAKLNCEKYNVDIKTVLSNGFENIAKNDFDTVVIAGMGGELIAKIISECEYIKENDYTLILQAMSKAYKLREFLFNEGFSIVKEEAVKDKGKIYSVMSVKYAVSKNNCEYMGQLVPKSEYSLEYAQNIIKDLKNRALSGEDLKSKILEIEEKYL